MSRTFSRISKAWAFGLTAYALVYTREVPLAYAQSVIETDCSTELDQPNTTYLLNTNVPGTCIIAADNIIVDGQNLYTISGNVQSTTTATVSFTVRDVEVGGNVDNQHASGAVEDLTIENAYVYGDVRNLSLNANTGTITVVDSTIHGSIQNDTGYYTTGDIVVDNSTVDTRVSNGGYEGAGSITITDSTINGEVYSYTYEGNAGDITLQNSTIERLQTGSDTAVVITGSTIGDNPLSKNVVRAGELSLTDSTIYGDTGINSIISVNSVVRGQLHAYICDLADSVVTDGEDNSEAYCTTLTVTDNPPELTITPLSLELDMGDSFNPFSGIEAEDIKDGDISDDVIVIGSVGEEPGVYELIYSITDGGTTLFNDFDNATTTSGPSTASTTRTVTRLAAESSDSQSTRVSTRTADTRSDSHTTSTPSTSSQTLDETLDELRVVLAQPITTTDPESLQKLMSLLLELVRVLTEVMARR